MRSPIQSTYPRVFFGGDSAFGPKNIIWAVAHGHAGGDLDRPALPRAADVSDRPPPHVTLISQKMGIHEWSYDNDISLDQRKKVPLPRAEASRSPTSRRRSSSASTGSLGYEETQRCLNCDVQTVFSDTLCIECDACVDICPMDCITFTANGPEDDLRRRLNAPGA